MKNLVVLGLLLRDRSISPLGWRNGDFSKKEIRRLTKKFKKDDDVLMGIAIDYRRIYPDKQSVMVTLPEV